METALDQVCNVSAANWAEVLTELADRGEVPGRAIERLTDAGILGATLVVHALDAEQARAIAELRAATRATGLRWPIAPVWRWLCRFSFPR